MARCGVLGIRVTRGLAGRCKASGGHWMDRMAPPAAFWRQRGEGLLTGEAGVSVTGGAVPEGEEPQALGGGRGRVALLLGPLGGCATEDSPPFQPLRHAGVFKMSSSARSPSARLSQF